MNKKDEYYSEKKTTFYEPKDDNSLKTARFRAFYGVRIDLGGADMEFQTNLLNGVMTVGLSGDIDERTAKIVREYLDKAIQKYYFHTLILDFHNVDFMDSTGIGVLLGRYKKIKASGGEICVRNLNAQLDKVFRISGLYQIIKAV